MAVPYGDLGLGDFLDLVAKRQPAPGGGAVAAVSVSSAASLVAMAGRYSTGCLDGAEELVDEAERLRVRAVCLADDDATAYGEVIAAHASVRQGDGTVGRADVRAALTRAAEVPLEVAELGAATARLAALLVADGKRDIRGDAATALLLAEASTLAAAHLVAVNVEAGGGDHDLLRRATQSAVSARQSAASVRPPAA
jgi:formiminotetrahydrofolate cyclodeaminase